MIGNSMTQNSRILDREIARRAENTLRKSPYHWVRTVSCDFEHGRLVLHGKLPSFYHKQLAQQAVARVAGVNAVLNEIEVVGGGAPAVRVIRRSGFPA